MRFPNHVSCAYDIAAFLDYLPVTPSCHDHLLVLPTPPFFRYKPVALSIEMLTPMLWPPGFALGDNEFTTTVYHNYVWIALDGHDVGKGIPHLSIDFPPTDVLFVNHILQSSRKAKFRAGEVKADGEAIACCTFFDQAQVPTPMLVCGKIPAPISGTGTAVWLNSLLVGMHGIDLVMGWIDIAITIFVAYVKRNKPSGLSNAIGDVFDVDWEPDLGAWAAGLVGLAGQARFDYHGDVTFSYTPIGGHAADGGISITQSGTDGEITGAVEGRLGPSFANVQGRGEVSRHADGHWSADGRVGVGTLAGGDAHVGANTDDGAYSDATAPSLPATVPDWAGLPSL